jgi:hypothetical protein
MAENNNEEATDEVNAPEPKEEESSSEEENLETEEKTEPESKEPDPAITEDYLEEDKPEIDYKKRYGDSTKGFQEYKEKAEPAIEAVKRLEELSEANPNILSEIEKAKAMGQGDNKPDSPDLVDQKINKALEPIKKVTQDLENKERMSRVKVLAAFEKKNPKLFPPKASAEDKRAIRQRIGKVANTLVETGMTFSEAVDRAYLTVNPKAAEKKGRDKAYVEGLSEERAGFSSQTSTEGAKPKKVKHSKRELEIGDKMGVGQAMREDKS